MVHRLLKLFLKPHFFILIFTFIIGGYLLTLNFSQIDRDYHTFFAKHYRNNWFSLYDSQLGGGIYLGNYPPLTHQIIAFFSYLLPLNVSYLIVILMFWVLLTFYSIKFFLNYIDEKETYVWPMFLFSFFSLGMFREILVYSWITITAGLAFAFISLHYFILFIKNKNVNKLYFIFPAILALFTHPYSFVFLLGIYYLIIIFDYKNITKKTKLRFIILLFLVGIITYNLIFYFLGDVLNYWIELNHPSRNPLLPDYIYDWFYTNFGLSLLMIILSPLLFIFYKSLRKISKIYFIALLFLIIGLGRTTPLSKILFDGLEKWLTFDPFLFLSSIFLSSLLGFFVIKLTYFHFKSARTIIIVLFVLFIFYLVYDISEALNLDPLPLHNDTKLIESRNFVLKFLNSKQSNYAYQTFGYPSSIGGIYLNTNMHTTDSDYFSFNRSLDFIRGTNVKTINKVSNTTFLLTFFNNTAKYSVKYVITYNDFYANITKGQNWKIIENKTFNNLNVIIWENPNKIEPLKPTQERITLFNYLWGIAPLSTLFIFIFMLAYDKRHKLQRC